MIFHAPRKETQTLTLKIDNINIEQVNEFNFLGLTLDPNITWKKHVNKIANKFMDWMVRLYFYLKLFKQSTKVC